MNLIFIQSRNFINSDSTDSDRIRGDFTCFLTGPLSFNIGSSNSSKEEQKLLLLFAFFFSFCVYTFFYSAPAARKDCLLFIYASFLTRGDVSGVLFILALSSYYLSGPLEICCV